MQARRRAARFNRAFANRMFGAALIRLPGFGAVHHRGRRSGREYRTPVKVFRRGPDYVIALPYGAGADWVRNVLAAGGCELTARGTRIPLGRPTVEPDDGRAIPGFLRAVLVRVNCTEYLVLRPPPHSAGESGPRDAG